MEKVLVLTVSQLNTYSKSILDQDRNLSNVFVVGEISNFVDHYRSGHLYMSIKDSNASIKAVMFAGNASKLKFKPENGMSVIIRGRVSIYERDGSYQLYIDDMQPDGIGSLAIAFEQLKEGLFDDNHKLAIPKCPSKIGVISSPTGAAIQDILNVLNRRFPLAEVVLAGVQVQGDSAPQQIVNAIETFNELNNVDVIIIARGGGSVEDLWQFNNEKIAYAIYNSHIPIVSGVGHETDFTICDFVSDFRAPTPSAAAELVVPDKNQQIYYISSLFNTINAFVDEKISNEENRIALIRKSNALTKPEAIVDNCSQYVDGLYNRLNLTISDLLNSAETEFAVLCATLDSLSPIKVLSRGYAITIKNDKIITSIDKLKIDDEIEIDYTDGKVIAKILEVKWMELNYEKAVKRLEEIVVKLEDGTLPLEESLKLYEEGAKLADFCNKTLKEARQKITNVNGEKIDVWNK